MYLRGISFQIYVQSINEQTTDQKFTDRRQESKEMNTISQPVGVATSNLAYKILGQWDSIWA